jgi:hypothetical protein
MRLKWVLVGIALTYGLIVLALSTAWYSDQMLQPFHFFNDLPEWKQLDSSRIYVGLFTCVRLLWAY